MVSIKPTSPYRKEKRKVANNNFLEALRSLGEDFDDTAADDLVGGVGKDAFDQILRRKTSGDLKPNKPFEFGKNSFEANAERRTGQFQREYFDIRQQERLIFTKTEQETKAKIAAILQELKKLALSSKNLAQEVEIAAAQVPVNPGAYHLNFFEKLKQTLILLRESIDASATWLAAFNHRSKKRNYYWGQFKKSGTKFILSQERYMSTQAG